MLIKLLTIISAIAVSLKFFGIELAQSYTYNQALVPFYVALSLIFIVAARQAYLEYHMEKFLELLKNNDREAISKKGLYVEWYNKALEKALKD